MKSDSTYTFNTSVSRDLPWSTPELSHSTTTTPTPSSPSTPTMARLRGTVKFAPPEVARDPLPDERSALRDFCRHLGRCDQCRHSLDTQKGPFCPTGLGCYVDMAPYFFVSQGKPYSKLDKDLNLRTRVIIPREFDLASEFFESLFRGFDPRPAPRSTVVHHASPRPVPKAQDYNRPPPKIVYARPDSHRPRAERYHEEYRDRDYYVPAGRRNLYEHDDIYWHTRPRYERYIVVPEETLYRWRP